MDTRQFVKRHFYKDELKELLEDEDLRVGGDMDTLIDRLQTEAGFTIFDFLKASTKDELKEICEDHDLPVSGLKDTLIERIVEEVIEFTEDEMQEMEVELEDEIEEEEPEPPIRPLQENTEVKSAVKVETQEVQQIPYFDGLVQAIKAWVPHRRYSTEEGYATDLRSYLQNAKGYDCRAEAGESTADIEVDRRYPIEVKKNPRLSQYDRLIGQLIRHCRSKGCAIAVICDVKRGDLFADFRHNVVTGLTYYDRIAIISKPL